MSKRVGERYELLDEIGKGGMGTVFSGRDTREDRPCAIKIIREEAVFDPDARERFEREARAPRAIGHSGVVEVYDAFVDDDGRMVLVMELLRGKSLRALMGTVSLREEQLAVVLAALEPLAAVHAAGYVHRDLKPDNIFVAVDDEGMRRVKLLDFGIVRDLSSGGLTQTGVIVGSVDYISPEQAHSARAVEPSSDVFSVGVILYEICSGERPFRGDSPLRTLGNLSAGRFRPLDERVAGLPSRLVDVVHECLAFEASARPRDANALLQRLSPLVDASLPSLSRSIPPPEPDRSSAVRPIATMPEVTTPMESARGGLRARGATFIRTIKALKVAMRSGLSLGLSEEDRDWLDQRVLVSGWYPFDRFAWVTGLLHERVMGGTDGAAITMGRLAAEELLTGIHSRFVYPGDVHRTFRSAKNAWTRYFDFGEIHVEPLSAHEVELTITGYEFAPRVHELMLIGWVRAMVELSGATVRDHDLLRAPSRGDAVYQLRIRWNVG